MENTWLRCNWSLHFESPFGELGEVQAVKREEEGGEYQNMRAVKREWESRMGKSGVVWPPCKGKGQVGEILAVSLFENCDNIQVLLNICCSFRHKGTCKEAQVWELWLIHLCCLFCFPSFICRHHTMVEQSWSFPNCCTQSCAEQRAGEELCYWQPLCLQLPLLVPMKEPTIAMRYMRTQACWSSQASSDPGSGWSVMCMRNWWLRKGGRVVRMDIRSRDREQCTVWL